MPKKNNSKNTIQSVIDRNDVNISANVDESYVFTTEDKIKLLYTEYNEAKKYTSNFFAWLGIFLTILISLITCDFKSFWIFEAATIKAIFCVSLFITFIICILGLVQSVRNKYKLTFDYFIKKLRGDSND